jgi:ferric-dicitrate binding protein FerR (iron transport regulator)
MNIGENIEHLIVRYLSGELNENETLQLKEWIALSSGNKDYFNKIKASWMLSGKASDLMNFNSTEAWGKAKHSMIKSRTWDLRPKTPKYISYLRIAASWIIIFMLGSLVTYLVLDKKSVKEAAITEVFAPLGAKSRVLLPDGTVLWLNAGSKLTYSNTFNVKDRVVDLSGEAFFHVKTNKAKPFIVKTSDIIVRALGTKFNVKAYPDEKTITATLEEGKIDVQVTNSSKKQGKIILKPNENVVFHKEGFIQTNIQEDKKVSQKPVVSEQNVEIQENIKTELYTSWKEDRWIIESEPLSSLIPKLERRFNLKICFTDKELTKYKFTGTFKNETAEQIMNALRFTAPVDYKITKDTISLYMNQNLKDKFTRTITHKN